MKSKTHVGMTVREVARALSMSPAMVHRIERAAIAKVIRKARELGLAELFVKGSGGHA